MTQTNGKNILCLWIGRINIIKILLKTIYRFNVKIPYQNVNGIFHRTRTNNSKIGIETQKTLNSLNNLQK